MRCDDVVIIGNQHGSHMRNCYDLTFGSVQLTQSDIHKNTHAITTNLMLLCHTLPHDPSDACGEGMDIQRHFPISLGHQKAPCLRAARPTHQCTSKKYLHKHTETKSERRSQRRHTTLTTTTTTQPGGFAPSASCTFYFVLPVYCQCNSRWRKKNAWQELQRSLSNGKLLMALEELTTHGIITHIHTRKYSKHHSIEKRHACA